MRTAFISLEPGTRKYATRAVLGAEEVDLWGTPADLEAAASQACERAKKTCQGARNKEACSYAASTAHSAESGGYLIQLACEPAGGQVALCEAAATGNVVEGVLALESLCTQAQQAGLVIDPMPGPQNLAGTYRGSQILTKGV